MSKQRGQIERAPITPKPQAALVLDGKKLFSKVPLQSATDQGKLGVRALRASVRPVG